MTNANRAFETAEQDRCVDRLKRENQKLKPMVENLSLQRHFTLLKFENLTFTAKRQEGKEAVKKTLALPRTKKPDEWEKQVIEQLTQAFTFSRSK